MNLNGHRPFFTDSMRHGQQAALQMPHATWQAWSVGTVDMVTSE